MQLTINIDEARLTEILQEQASELFLSGYQHDEPRREFRKMIDQALGTAITENMKTINVEEITAAAVRTAVKEEADKAAKRGLGVLRKQFAGFNPAKLPEDQRAWLEEQIAKAAKTQEVKPT